MGMVRLTQLREDTVETRRIVELLTGDPPDEQKWLGDVLRVYVADESDEQAAKTIDAKLYTCDERWFEHLRVDLGANP